MTQKGSRKLRRAFHARHKKWAGRFWLKNHQFNTFRVRPLMRGQGDYSRWPTRYLYDRRWDWHPVAFILNIERMRALRKGH